jgi:filamentous hemagglutinin
MVAGTVHDNDSVGNPIFFGNATASGTETGNVVIVMSNEDGTSNDALGSSVQADLAGGDVTLGFTSASPHGPSHSYAINTAHTFNLLSSGDLVIAGSVQNAGTGAINLVAGWDGHTLAPASFSNAGVFGNNSGAVVIGGAHAASNVAIGSAGGTTSVYAASLSLSATNGYAQLGVNGNGTGAIDVTISGDVTIAGGSAAGQFAQIGNGGLNTSGNNGGDIDLTAGGDLTLSGGAGTNSYAQIGHGGALSNSNSAGYSNVAPITITAANVMLNAGSGDATYVQIGNGGFKSGTGLTGSTGTNGGDIMITSANAVTLQANGADAYAQIGNGGDQSNLNPAAAAGGVDSGDIVVHAPGGAAGAVMLTAGSGANAYAQIGNGGYSANAGANATAANFTMLGSISVTDLSLTGGNTSGNSYAQIGNGDAALASYGDASGDIVIAANGTITYNNGSAPHSPAVIGNFTGQGSTSGTVTGASPPPPTIIGNPGIVGVIVTLVSNPISNPANNPNNTLLNGPVTLIETEVVPSGAENAAGSAGAGLTVTTEGPIASLSGEAEDSPNASDSGTVVIADSLNGADKPSTSKSLMGGYLTQVTPVAAGQTIHGIPPADQDFSSWGNEALWR